MLLLVLFSTVFRSSMALTPVFWQLLALVALSQFFGGPITVLADTATMAVCKDVRGRAPLHCCTAAACNVSSSCA